MAGLVTASRTTCRTAPALVRDAAVLTDGVGLAVAEAPPGEELLADEEVLAG